MKSTVNKLILDRRSCKKLDKKFRFTPDPVFITSSIYRSGIISSVEGIWLDAPLSHSLAQILCYCKKDNLCSLLDSGRQIFHWSKLTMLRSTSPAVSSGEERPNSGWQSSLCSLEPTKWLHRNHCHVLELLPSLLSFLSI